MHSPGAVAISSVGYAPSALTRPTIPYRTVASIRGLNIFRYDVIRRRVLHHPHQVGDERLVVAGAAQEAEANLHAGVDAAARNNAARVQNRRRRSAPGSGGGEDLNL